MLTEPSPADVRRRMALVRVAKDVFLSNWYHDSADALISPAGRVTMRRISEESREERERVMQLVQEWAEAAAESEVRDDEALRALQVAMAQDFLDQLIAIKQASAEVLHKAAFVAPVSMRERFLELANLDVVHAMQLRELMLREFPLGPMFPVPTESSGDGRASEARR